MTLYHYFKAPDTKLPNLWDLLSKAVPSTSLAPANGEVRRVLQLPQMPKEVRTQNSQPNRKLSV